MIRILVLATICSVGLADAGYAQSRNTVVELGGGAGYVFGAGAENPGPSLPSFDVIAFVWPFERWGVGVRYVEAPGEDLHEPSVSFDRTFLGQGHLRYWTVSARHRRPVTRQLGFELGFGMLVSGEFASIQELHDPPRRLSAADTFFNGFSVDGLLTRQIVRHVGIKAGVTFDFNVETTNFQPVVLGVIRF